MFEVSIVFAFVAAQVVSMQLLLVGIAMLTRADFFRDVIKKIDAKSPALMVLAVLGLGISVLLVEFMTNWESLPRSIFTIVCWGGLISSLSWLFSPEKFTNSIKKIATGLGYYYVSTAMCVLGSTMLVIGFYRVIRAVA